jgi:hypothetical protein
LDPAVIERPEIQSRDATRIVSGRTQLAPTVQFVASGEAGCTATPKTVRRTISQGKK